MKSDFVFDLIIIGAGPSGSILSYLLDNKLTSICIVDRRKFVVQNSAFNKACGGLLAPDAQKALAQIGISIPCEILASPQIFAVKTIDLETKQSRYYQRFYINTNREKFDAYLALLPTQNTKKLYGKTVTDIKYVDNIYHVSLNDGTTIMSRLLIGADGAASITAKKLKIIPKTKKYVSIQQIFEANNNQNLYSAVFSKNITKYSGWTFVKDNKTYVGAAFEMKDDPHSKLDKMIKGLEDCGYIFYKPLKREGAILNRPIAFLKAPVCNNNTAGTIGEAAGFVSPTSAEGISYAINSALYVYQSIVKYNDLRGYRKSSFKIRVKLFLKNFKIPFMYNKFMRNVILKSGLSSISTLNDL